MKTSRLHRAATSVMALMLAASMFAAVPASAANTASEALIDTNNDGIGDAREFAGADRYDTALRLATNFAESRGGVGTLPVALLASGESLVDAVAASSLAGYHDSPVLLTPTDSLPSSVGGFLEDYGVTTVYVLGGPAAVSDAVVESIEGLVHQPVVERVAGPDRYATAAAIAAQVGVGGIWCGGTVNTAIVVSGRQLEAAMLVGPAAYKLRVPVLLTQPDSLPEATTEFITDMGVENVLIVGDHRDVTPEVEAAIEALRGVSAERVGAAEETWLSVTFAKYLSTDCAADIELSPNTAALVNATALPDGITSAPVLGHSYDSGFMVPILSVSGVLPDSVHDYLASTPSEDAAGMKINYKLVAIGGTAVVSEPVMDAAIEAASSASLSVKIGGITDTNDDGTVDAQDAPRAGDEAVVLYFSDSVAPVGDISGPLRDVLYLNNTPARLAAEPFFALGGPADPCALTGDAITVVFDSPLIEGDVISVELPDQSPLRFGAGGDQRPLVGTTASVGSAPVDRTRPEVEVVMIAGQTSAAVFATDVSASASITQAEVTFHPAAPDSTVVVTSVTGLTAVNFSGALEPGDRLTVSRGAVADDAGNMNNQRTFTAAAPKPSPRVVSVLVSTERHSDDAIWTVPDVFTGSSSDADRISINAKSDGPASGAVGNEWRFVFDVSSTWTAEGDTDIDVVVSPSGKAVSVRFADGAATYGDLKTALEGNSAFNTHFEIALPTANGCTAALERNLVISSGNRGIAAEQSWYGFTDVDIEVRFSDWIAAANHDELLMDVLGGALARSNVSIDDLRLSLNISPTDLSSSEWDALRFDPPAKVVRYMITTAEYDWLPKQRDLVVVEAARDADPSATPPVTAVVAVADGYAEEDASTAGKESQNGASQVRITHSRSLDN